MNSVLLQVEGEKPPSFYVFERMGVLMIEKALMKFEKPRSISSVALAGIWGKRHGNLLRDIRKVVSSGSGLSPNFTQRNYIPAEYMDCLGRLQPMYNLTPEGLAVLGLSRRGPVAMQLREKFVEKLNLTGTNLESKPQNRQSVIGSSFPRLQRIFEIVPKQETGESRDMA